MKRYVYFISCIFASAALSGTASAATFNLLTDKTQFAIGDTFNVDVKIDSEDVGINAAQATVNYPVSILQETAVDRANSIFAFWLKDPTADNTNGAVSFIGGSTSGLTGKTLHALRITFKVVGSGSAKLSFTDGAITAADGNGTNVLSLMNGLSIVSSGTQTTSVIASPSTTKPASSATAAKPITRPAVPTGKVPVAPVLDIPIYPASGGWSNIEMPFIASWGLPLDVTGVATAVDQQPVLELKKTEGLFDNKSFAALSADGIWYLHVRFKNDIGWSTTTNYKIGIDTTPPLPFELTIKEGNSTYVTTPTVSYETNDQPSGIRMYRILVDNNEVGVSKDASFMLPAQAPGKYTVTVIAEDLAGNKTSTSAEVVILEQPFLVLGGFSLSFLAFFGILILILVLVFGTWWYSYHMWGKQLERRVIIAERDIGDALGIISSDAEKIMDLVRETKISAKDANEVEFLAKKIKDKVSSSRKYIIENIRDITSK